MAGIFARLPMLDTRLVIFDTSVVDLSGYAGDPVEISQVIFIRSPQGGGQRFRKIHRSTSFNPA